MVERVAEMNEMLPEYILNTIGLQCAGVGIWAIVHLYVVWRTITVLCNNYFCRRASVRTVTASSASTATFLCTRRCIRARAVRPFDRLKGQV